MSVQYNDNPPRDVLGALLSGFHQSCPSCGRGSLFNRYLKVERQCAYCGEELHHQRADDAPPYFTILIIGHVTVPLVLLVETLYRPELWIQAVIWIPITLVAALLPLPAIKGGLIAYQWALHMHGFDPKERETLTRPDQLMS